MDARLRTAGVRSEIVMIEGAKQIVVFALPDLSDRAEAFVNELLLSP